MELPYSVQCVQSNQPDGGSATQTDPQPFRRSSSALTESQTLDGVSAAHTELQPLRQTSNVAQGGSQPPRRNSSHPSRRSMQSSCSHGTSTAHTEPLLLTRSPSRSHGAPVSDKELQSLTRSPNFSQGAPAARMALQALESSLSTSEESSSAQCSSSRADGAPAADMDGDSSPDIRLQEQGQTTEITLKHIKRVSSASIWPLTERDWMRHSDSTLNRQCQAEMYRHRQPHATIETPHPRDGIREECLRYQE